MLDIDQEWQCKWDHLPERLSSSTAVRPSCHPLLTPQEFLWSPVKTSASRAVIAPQEVLARPGTGAAAVAIPGVLQKLLLSKAETLGGTAASAWMMDLILKNLKNEEKLQHFHKRPCSCSNAAHQINKFGTAFAYFWMSPFHQAINCICTLLQRLLIWRARLLLWPSIFMWVSVLAHKAKVETLAEVLYKILVYETYSPSCFPHWQYARLLQPWGAPPISQGL